MATVEGNVAGEACARAADFLSGRVWPRALGIVVVSSVAVAWQFWQKRLHESLPPGSFGLPVIGQSVQYFLDPIGFMERGWARFGCSFRTHLLTKPSVVLRPTDENLRLMSKEANAGWPVHIVRLLGKDALSVVNGDAHTRLRKVGTRAFTDEMLEKYLQIEQACTEATLQEWASRRRLPKDMLFDCKMHTFSLAQQSLLGMRMPESELRRVAKLFHDWLGGFVSLPVNLPGFRFGKAMASRRKILKEYKAALDKRRAALDEGAPAECMVDTILSGAGMTESEILDFVLVMLFAAHDTSAVAMQTLLYYLKSVPDAASLEAELRCEVDANWDGASPITRRVLRRVPKVHAFIQECLRLAPPAPIFQRELYRDATVEGYLVPKGYYLVMSTDWVGRRVKDPEKFDLHRHLDSNHQFDERVFQIDAPGFGVFGAGPRSCIGYRFARDELAVFVLVLLRKYDYRLQSTVKRIRMPFSYWQCSPLFMERPN